ncbi:MAG TPA: metallophosphoesterase [Clostridiales bacterium]|nr:metallophosphoesterase [Clostridiales bacterium]
MDLFLRSILSFFMVLLTSLNIYPAGVAGNTAPDRADDPVLRFAVCSDIHMHEQKHDAQYNRLEQLFEYSYEYAESQNYKSVDAFIFVGDITDSGTAKQMENVLEVVNNKMKPGTPLMCVYDNHDVHNRTIAECEAFYGIPANEQRVINGFNFITVSYDDNHSYASRLPSLYAQLEAAKKADPKKPIFVFNHRHIEGTVYGSTNWGTTELSPVLNNFPQIIDFSGHSHYPVNDPRSCSQYFFTSFGCGTLFYFELERDMMTYGSVPPNAGQAAQFYIVEVYADNAVAVKPFNILTGEFFKVPSSYSDEQLIYYIAEPSNRDSFTYTSKRYMTADTPVWPAGAEAEISEITENSAKVSFPQALDFEAIHSYRVEVKKGGIKVKDYRFWSEYYFEPMPERMTWLIDGLDPQTNYRVEITGYDTYTKQTVKKLVTEFSTF